uniref:CAF1 family ribonuclease containing protein n=1 Tax=Oryza sativa subsp. japonica TaxID=39947 RepID=Q7XEI1_ORYSJ|nr:CAF1 family ribonuclease containing protein [Oryza sativa Japonica Group]
MDTLNHIGAGDKLYGDNGTLAVVLHHGGASCKKNSSIPQTGTLSHIGAGSGVSSDESMLYDAVIAKPGAGSGDELYGDNSALAVVLHHGGASCKKNSSIPQTATLSHIGAGSGVSSDESMLYDAVIAKPGAGLDDELYHDNGTLAVVLHHIGAGHEKNKAYDVIDHTATINHIGADGKDSMVNDHVGAGGDQNKVFDNIGALGMPAAQQAPPSTGKVNHYQSSDHLGNNYHHDESSVRQLLHTRGRLCTRPGRILVPGGRGAHLYAAPSYTLAAADQIHNLQLFGVNNFAATGIIDYFGAGADDLGTASSVFDAADDITLAHYLAMATVQSVWQENCMEQFKLVLEALHQPHRNLYIAVDMEFTADAATNMSHRPVTSTSCYQHVRRYVNGGDIVQMGLTFAFVGDVEGEQAPSPPIALEINFDFNVNSPKYHGESIHFLSSQGHDLTQHSKRGVTPEFVYEGLLRHLPFGDGSVTWVAYHGDYDLAFLLRLLQGGDHGSDALLTLSCFFKIVSLSGHQMHRMDARRGLLAGLEEWNMAIKCARHIDDHTGSIYVVKMLPHKLDEEARRIEELDSDSYEIIVTFMNAEGMLAYSRAWKFCISSRADNGCVHPQQFAKFMASCGALGDPNISWVTFHGAHGIARMIRSFDIVTIPWIECKGGLFDVAQALNLKEIEADMEAARVLLTLRCYMRLAERPDFPGTKMAVQGLLKESCCWKCLANC